MATEDTPTLGSGLEGERRRVLVVGAASRDVTPADPRGWRLGGAVTYASLTLARLGCEVRALVGVDREAAAAHELDLLRDAGVGLALARLQRGPVFENIELPGGRIQRCIGASDQVAPTELPIAWGDEPAVVLAAVAAELGDDWVAVARAHEVVALTWQGLLRDLQPGEIVRQRPPAPSPLVVVANLVGVSPDDVAPGTTVASLMPLLAPGAALLMTDGERGGTIAIADSSQEPHRYAAIPADAVLDPTGAGDVFLAATVAARVLPELMDDPDGWPRAASTFAAAASSLCVEAPGLLGVPALDAVMDRMRRAAPRSGDG